MKKLYKKPFVRVAHIAQQEMICTSPYGPDSEGIPFEGEGGDEEIYHPA